jgi:predicted PhzF superfamily epimerase YddE/YHI9
MDFPATPVQEASPPEGLMEALGLADTPVFTGLTRFDFLVEVAKESTVRSLAPNFDRLRGLGTRGFIITSRADPAAGASSADVPRAGLSDDRYDFVSRFFAPAVGVNEDPVTGSAHCGLGPYWGHKLGKAEMTAFQASARGGVVRVRPSGDRVILGGQAVTTMRSELTASVAEADG